MKIVLQDGIKDCGICSLLSIIRFYGGNVSKEYLRQLTNTTKNGVSAFQLIEGAKKIGFLAMGMKGDVLQIQDEQLPCIAHLVFNKKYKHFVVIYQIDRKKERIICMDPAKGKRIFTFSEFLLYSTQNYIFLKPKQSLPNISSKRVIFRMIILFLKEKKCFCILLFLLTVVYFVLHILLAFHFKYLLEFSIQYFVSTNILSISVYLFFLYLLREGTNFFRNILLMKWLSLFDVKTIYQTYRQILLLPYLYYKNRTTGEVVSRFRDLTVVKEFLANFICSFFTDVIGMIVFLLFMVHLQRKMSIFVFCSSTFLFLFFILFHKKKRILFMSVRKQEDKVNSYLVESLSNVDTVKGTHVEKGLLDRFMIKYCLLLEGSYRLSFFTECLTFFRQIGYDFLFVFIYGYFSFFVVNGQLSLGELLVFQSFLLYYFQSGDRLLSLFDQFHQFIVSLRRIEDLFTIRAEEFSSNFYYLAYDLKGVIQFSQVSYQVGSCQLFKDLNLVIPFGQKVLLTGDSGCGKSTLVKLLLRYLEVSYGNVSIAGIDINHYHLENLRSYITYVTSFEFLYTDTIYANITMNKEVDDAIFEKVTSIAMVDEIVSRDTLKYQRMIEENGFHFSNGERQRIILARSILRNSNIFIFDEALSQIDVTRERTILSQLFQYLKDKTVIVISHRFYQQDLFDRILKLEDGKICEVEKL